MLRTDLNINSNHKFSFNYLQLNSSSDNHAVGLDLGRLRPPHRSTPTT